MNAGGTTIMNINRLENISVIVMRHHTLGVVKKQQKYGFRNYIPYKKHKNSIFLTNILLLTIQMRSLRPANHAAPPRHRHLDSDTAQRKHWASTLAVAVTVPHRPLQGCLPVLL